MAWPGPDSLPSEQERLRKQQRERLAELKTVNAELADLSWTLAELEQQIATLEAEDVAHGDGRAERRIADLRRWRGMLEERVLRHMYRADHLSAEIARLRAALEQATPG
ncbi:MAG: hypothetical protein OHK0015_31050 [Chloroflexi bacterium OHK40]